MFLNFLKRDFNADLFLWILRIIQEHSFCRASTNGWFFNLWPQINDLRIPIAGEVEENEELKTLLNRAVRPWRDQGYLLPLSSKPFDFLTTKFSHY